MAVRIIRTGREGGHDYDNITGVFWMDMVTVRDGYAFLAEMVPSTSRIRPALMSTAAGNLHYLAAYPTRRGDSLRTHSGGQWTDDLMGAPIRYP